MSRYVPPQQRGGITSPPPASSGLSASSGRVASRRFAPPVQEEFPSLAPQAPRATTASATSAWSASSSSRFADLARTWGVQQREQEEEKKHLAKQRMTEEILKREQNEKDRAFYRVGLAQASQMIYRGSSGQAEEDASRYDLGGGKAVVLDDMDSEEEMYVPEEEERSGGGIRAVDGEYRKSRHDLY